MGLKSCVYLVIKNERIDANLSSDSSVDKVVPKQPQMLQETLATRTHLMGQASFPAFFLFNLPIFFMSYLRGL